MIIKYFPLTKLIKNFNCAQSILEAEKIGHVNFVSEIRKKKIGTYLELDANRFQFSTKYNKTQHKTINKKQQQTTHDNKESKSKSIKQSNSSMKKTQHYPNSNNNKKNLKQFQPASSQKSSQSFPNLKIIQLNSSIKKFIDQHTASITISSPKEADNIQLPPPVTSLILSNLYKFILIKKDQLKVNVNLPISLENRKRIEELLKNLEIYEINNKNWSLLKHEQMCDVLYLAVMVGQKRILPNIKNNFLTYLQTLPPQLTPPTNPPTNLSFTFTHQSIPTTPPQPHTISLSISISSLFPPHVILNNDNFAYQIIKTIIQYRSVDEVIDVMRGLARLLTAKQLKGVDQGLLEGWLTGTEREVGEEKSDKELNGDKKIENSNNRRLLKLDQVIRLASILSQLNLNSHSIHTCQRIFSHHLHNQLTTFTSLLQQLSSSLQQNTTNPSQQQPLSSTISTLPLPLLKFDQIMKFYISVAEIGAIDRDLQYLVEKLFVVKFRVRQVLEKVQDKAIVREVRKKFGMVSEKEAGILVGVLHKFKRNGQVILLKPIISKIKSQSLHHPSHYNTIWLSLYNFYTHSPSSSSIPQHFIFSLISGLYRSFSSLMLHSMFDQKIKKRITEQEVLGLGDVLGQAFSSLVKKLYEVDQEVAYLEDLQLEKLIQFAIVVQMVMMVGVVGNIKGEMKIRNREEISKNNSNLQMKTNTLFYSTFIDKIISKLQKSKQKLTKQPQTSSNKQEQQQLQPFSSKSQQQQPNNSISFQQPPSLSRKQLKQKEEIYLLLQFYLLFTKAHVESLNFKNNKNKRQDKKESREQRSQIKKIDEIMVLIREKLKKVKMTEQTMVLVSNLIRNSKRLAESLNKTPQSSSNSTAETPASLQQFTNNLQSFIGFCSQSSINQYQNQLNSNLITNVFSHILDDPGMVSSLTQALLDNQKQSSQYVVEKFLMNYIMTVEEIVRIRLISDENDFRQFDQQFVMGNNDGLEGGD